MKLNRKHDQDNGSGDSNLLPLVNIIFLLLIFFLIAGVIEKRRDLFDIELPQATLEQFSAKVRPEMHIYPNGKIKLGDSNVTIKNLFKSLNRKYPKLEAAELLITADANVTSEHLNQILLILNQAKVKKISLLTLKNE